MIESGLKGKKTVGFFSKNRTSVLIIDLDAHARETEISSKLRIATKSISTQLGMEPSLAFKTPRGVHLVFFLRFSRSPLGLQTWISQKTIELPGKLVFECRPSTSHAIRLPQIASEIDPFTLAPRVTTIQPPVFDPPDLRIRTGRTRTSKRSQPDKKRSAGLDLSDMVFARGGSNRTFLGAAGRLFAAGIGRAEALLILENKLHADGYRGPLLRELSTRLNSSYRNLTRKGRAPSPMSDLPGDWRKLVELVAVRAPFKGQRRKTFRRFVTDLYLWRRYLETQNKDRASFEYRCDLYPSYREATRKGAFPLPYTLLRSWSDDHVEFMHWLESEALIYRVSEHRRPFSSETDDETAGVPGTSRYFWIGTPDQATNPGQDPGQSYNNTLTILTELEPAQIRILRDRDKLTRRSTMADAVRSCLEHPGIRAESELLECVRATSPRASLRALRDCISAHPSEFQKYTVRRRSDGRTMNLIGRQGFAPDDRYLVTRSPTEATRLSILEGLLALPEEEFAVTFDQARALAREHFFVRTDVSPMPSKRHFNEYFRRELDALVRTGHVVWLKVSDSVLYRRVR